MKNRACTILIPVRMGSSRLPNKPLKEIAGKPLLKWVIELAQNVNFEASLIAPRHHLNLPQIISRSSIFMKIMIFDDL